MKFDLDSNYFDHFDLLFSFSPPIFSILWGLPTCLVHSMNVLNLLSYFSCSILHQISNFSSSDWFVRTTILHLNLCYEPNFILKSDFLHHYLSFVEIRQFVHRPFVVQVNSSTTSIASYFFEVTANSESTYFDLYSIHLLG